LILSSTCCMIRNHCSGLNTTILELSETLFYTSVSVIVVVQSHFFTILWVHLYLWQHRTLYIMTETLQDSNTFLSCIRLNSVFKNFFKWSFGWKVREISKYIFYQYTKYVLGNHYNFWSELTRGMKVVTSWSVGLRDQTKHSNMESASSSKHLQVAICRDKLR
jgi:hypothetical protein